MDVRLKFEERPRYGIISNHATSSKEEEDNDSFTGQTKITDRRVGFLA